MEKINFRYRSILDVLFLGFMLPTTIGQHIVGHHKDESSLTRLYNVKRVIHCEI